jgi:hypothetical protein
MRALSPRFAAFALLAACSAVACDKGGSSGAPPEGTPPPPPSAETAKAGACATGGGQDTDSESAAYVPRDVRGTGGVEYCIDPQGQVRTYGEKGKLSMEEVCTTAVDGECEVYKRFGLSRFVSLRYVDGSGKGGSVEIYLSKYATADGAYGMYTKRVVADGDPADKAAPRLLDEGDAGALGAMGTGRAYVWKGQYVAELQYINENESPDELARSSAAILSPMAAAIGAKVPGTGELPPSAASLPTANRVTAQAITYWSKDALGLSGLGAGAEGYYKDGDRRYRLVALARTDADQAKDAFKSLKGRPGSLPVPSFAGVDEAAHVVLQSSADAPKVEWLVARKGALVIAAGDEELALNASDPPAKQQAARLTKDEAIAKLTAWLASAPVVTAKASK